MKIKKYKIKDQQVLLYSKEDFSPPEELKFELVDEEVDENLPILKYEELLLALLGKKTTRDKVLDEEGIRSLKDLKYAYNLVRNKMLNKSKRVRDYVEDKYAELIND